MATEISHGDLAKLRNEMNPPHKPGQEKDPSGRGEHIINNNVLNFYRDVVSTFVKNVLHKDLGGMINSGKLSRSSRVYRAITQPVTQRIADMIQTELVVHLDGKYVDRNAAAYGRQIQLMREYIGSYMDKINATLDGLNCSDILPGLERNIRDAVHSLIAGAYYVDDHALGIWRNKNGKSPKFDEAKVEVERMFKSLIYDKSNDTLIQWVKELREASGR